MDRMSTNASMDPKIKFSNSLCTFLQSFSWPPKYLPIGWGSLYLRHPLRHKTTAWSTCPILEGPKIISLKLLAPDRCYISPSAPLNLLSNDHRSSQHVHERKTRLHLRFLNLNICNAIWQDSILRKMHSGYRLHWHGTKSTCLSHASFFPHTLTLQILPHFKSREKCVE